MLQCTGISECSVSVPSKKCDWAVAKVWMHTSISVLLQHTVRPRLGTKGRSSGRGLQKYSNTATCSPSRFGYISNIPRGYSENPGYTYVLHMQHARAVHHHLSIHPHNPFLLSGRQKKIQKSNLQAGQFEIFNLFAVVSCCAVCASLGCSSCRCTFPEGSFGQFFSSQGLFIIQPLNHHFAWISCYTNMHKVKIMQQWRIIICKSCNFYLSSSFSHVPLSTASPIARMTLCSDIAGREPMQQKQRSSGALWAQTGHTGYVVWCYSL